MLSFILQVLHVSCACTTAAPPCSPDYKRTTDLVYPRSAVHNPGNSPSQTRARLPAPSLPSMQQPAPARLNKLPIELGRGKGAKLLGFWLPAPAPAAAETLMGSFPNPTVPNHGLPGFVSTPMCFTGGSGALSRLQPLPFVGMSKPSFLQCVQLLRGFRKHRDTLRSSQSLSCSC